MTPFTVAVERGAGRVVLTVAGEFDAARVDEFDAAARAARGADAVTVDLRSTTIVDSAALGALLRLQRSTEAASTPPATFEVLVARRFQVDLFRTTGLDALLGVRVVEPDPSDRRAEPG